ncbi:hypothetical protein ALMP_00030 [Streptomyces sp. A012304]|nr:hypothetical protein ALMP_00030 [Streptomyces sp. A012304]
MNAAVFEQIRLSPSPAHGHADEALQQQLAAGKATAVRCGRGGRLVQALGRGGSVDFPPAPAMYADRHGRLTLQAPGSLNCPRTTRGSTPPPRLSLCCCSHSSPSSSTAPTPT